jgi:hypothetical protein
LAPSTPNAPSKAIAQEDGCVSPRAVLARGARREDAKAAVAELLRVFPELETVTFEEQAGTTCESTFSARCSDGATCERLVFLLKEVDRTQHPRALCGPDPQAPPSHAVQLGARANAQAACARVRACELAGGGKGSTNCDLLPEPGVECAKEGDCAGVKRCAERAAERRPALPQARLPRARPLSDPCEGQGLGY